MTFRLRVQDTCEEADVVCVLDYLTLLIATTFVTCIDPHEMRG